MAIINSERWFPPRRGRSEGWRGLIGKGVLALAGAVVLFVTAQSEGERPKPPDAAPNPNAKALEVYIRARAAFRADPAKSEAAWRFGCACFDLADFATNNAQVEAIATEGIAVCRQLTEREPQLAAGHYYLGMNLGQLARSKTLGALALVREMESEFKAAARADADFDFAGPERNLGLLYQQAPGWPLSVGDRAKAERYLIKAADLAPKHPENGLCLLEAYIQWGDLAKARHRLGGVAAAMLAGENKSTRDPALPWLDWEKRWAQIQAKVGASRAP